MMVKRLLILLILVTFVNGCELKVEDNSADNHLENTVGQTSSNELPSKEITAKEAFNTDDAKSESINSKPATKGNDVVKTSEIKTSSIPQEEEKILTEEEQTEVDKRVKENRIKFLREGGMTEEEIEKALAQAETEELKETLSEEPEAAPEKPDEKIPEEFKESEINDTNIVVVIDISLGLKEYATIEIEEVISIIKILNETNDVGIIAFNILAYQVTNISPLIGHKNESIDKVSRQIFDSQTDFTAGINAANEMLESELGSKNIILITDGVMDYRRQKQIDNTKESARNAASKDIKIYVVGIGDKKDEQFLNEIAVLGNGAYFSKDAPINLKQIFG